MSSPSGITWGKPTKSQATSAPRPPVHFRTRFRRSFRSGTSLRLSVWSAPDALGSRRRVDPEPARPLDHHAVAEAEAGLVEAVDHLGERAVHRRDDFVGELVGDLEEEAAGAEVVVLGEGAVEVGKGAGSARAFHLVGAGGGGGASPRQKGRSEPQMLATLTRTRIPRGSTSGSGSSVSSNGLPGPWKTAGLPGAGMGGTPQGPGL